MQRLSQSKSRVLTLWSSMVICAVLIGAGSISATAKPQESKPQESKPQESKQSVLKKPVAELSADDTRLDNADSPKPTTGKPTTGKPATGNPETSKAAASSGTSRKTNAATFAEVLQIARNGVQHIDGEIRDYSCLLVKRERVEGVLGDYQYMVAKVRHENDKVPFSLYLRFLKPDDVASREVLFVVGANGGKIVAKKGGFRFSYLTTEIEPDSEMAMQGNRYPITEFGVQNLAHKLLEIAEDEQLAQDFDVELRHQSKVDQRECTSIMVKKRERTPDDQFYLARVFIDKELMVPIHFESYDWPVAGKSPRLLEQYTYRNLKLNVGLTATDFDRNNPSYGFRKKR